MADCREQHVAVKFCFLLGKSATETMVILKTAYEDAALNKTRVCERFSRLKNGEMSIEDQLRSGRPATSRSDENLDKINALIRIYRPQTIDQLCEMSGISWSLIHRTLSEDLRMGRVAAIFVPRLLTGEQSNRRL
ncbi:protein GVQW3-like [Belonocnema kinseyi]|uniref:protein GVQW3-like n=1 Tax=Belonocnema kinseyi TaxID=2817044 RepID=UPI00143DA59C|nr:protein GVQW3-like [Belonocnema kinseyi]